MPAGTTAVYPLNTFLENTMPQHNVSEALKASTRRRPKRGVQRGVIRSSKTAPRRAPAKGARVVRNTKARKR